MPAKPPCRDSLGIDGYNLFSPIRDSYLKSIHGGNGDISKKQNPKAVGVGGGLKKKEKL